MIIISKNQAWSFSVYRQIQRPPGAIERTDVWSYGAGCRKCIKILTRRTEWLFLNVKNVVQQRKADANRKNVRSALKQEPCRNRKKKNLPAAAVPVLLKNNPAKPGPCHINRQGLFYFFLPAFFYIAEPGPACINFCGYSRKVAKNSFSYLGYRAESFDINAFSLYFSRFARFSWM